MDDFREWLSDNLRYILLGVAIILVVVIAIFAVRLIGSLSGDSAKKEESESHSAAVVVQSEDESQSETEAVTLPLVKDNPDLTEIVQKYYTAVVNKDVDAVKQLVDSLDEESEQKILNGNGVESYNIISVYSKDGLTEGSYVTFIYHEAKVAGVETLAPGLSSLYIATREDGSLYVMNSSSDAAVTEYRDKISADADVQQLIKDVDDKWKAAEEAEPILKQMMDEMASPDTQSVLPDSSDVDVDVNKQVAATDVINVRRDSSEDAEIIGMLNIGETVTRIRELDNGWSEIRYGTETAYVKSEYLTEDTSSVQTQ